MRRTLLAMLLLSLLFSLLQTGPSLAQEGDVGFTVKAHVNAEKPFDLNITVDKDGKAHTEGTDAFEPKFDHYPGSSWSYVFEGRYDKEKGTLSGSLVGNVRYPDNLGSEVLDPGFGANMKITIQLERVDNRNLMGTYSGTYVFTQYERVVETYDINHTVTAQADRDIGQATTEEPEDDSSTEQAGADFTIVIPKGYPGFLNLQDTRIEVKNGVVDCVISFMNFDNVPVKGTYDPETGVLNATVTIAPQNDRENLWVGFEGNFKIDFSNEGTAGFMTLSGNMWQWLEDDGKWEEGDDKGPAGEFNTRVYYTVEYPSGEPGELKTPEYGEKVDANIRFTFEKGGFIKRAGSNELILADINTPIYVGDTIVIPPGGSFTNLHLTDSSGGHYFECEMNIGSSQEFVGRFRHRQVSHYMVEGKLKGGKGPVAVCPLAHHLGLPVHPLDRPVAYP